MARNWRKVLGLVLNVDVIEADYRHLSKAENRIELAHNIQDIGSYIVVFFGFAIGTMQLFDFVPTYGRLHDLFVLFATAAAMAISFVVNEAMVRSLGPLALRVCQTGLIVFAGVALVRAFR